MNDSNKAASRTYEEDDLRSRDLRVSMVCQVVSVDDCICSAVPAFRERVLDRQGRTISHQDMQAIEDVPIATIGGISFDVNVGDHGLLIFHDVSLDEYLDSQAIADLDSVSRFHDYTDAIFLPLDIRCNARGSSNIRVSDGEITINGLPVYQTLRTLLGFPI